MSTESGTSLETDTATAAAVESTKSAGSAEPAGSESEYITA